MPAPGALPMPRCHPSHDFFAQPRHPWHFQPRRAPGTRCCLPGAQGTSATPPAALRAPCPTLGGCSSGEGIRSIPGGAVPGRGRRDAGGALGASGTSGSLREPPGSRPPPLPSRVSPAHAAGAQPGALTWGMLRDGPAHPTHTGRGPGSPGRPSCPN